MTALRIAQWATGNIGMRSMEAVLDHPDMDLVAVRVYGDDKVGRDVGELCGRDATGVLATDDRDEIVAAGADCVLYMPRACDMDDVCALLEAGANVVTTRGEFHHPNSLDAATRDRVEAACRAGSSSIHSTGSSPGFITEAVPLVLTSIQRRLDCLTIDEFADMSPRNSPELMFDIMGFGRPAAPGGPGEEARVAHLRDAFAPSLRVLAESLGLALDDFSAHGELAMATRTVDIAAGTIDAGSVGGMRTVIDGRYDDRTLLRFRATWYCTADLDADWDLQSTGWRVKVEGDTPLDVTLHFPTPVAEMAAVTPGYTAHRAVNAVPVVCAAAPGIRTSVELPQVIARLG